MATECETGWLLSRPGAALLTGPVGVGKTTIAQRVVDLARQQGLICGGVLAPAITDHRGRKVGVYGIDLRTGERRTLARTDRDLGGPTVGVYSFDGEALAWAVQVVEQALDPRTTPPCDLVIVDEIGKLELWQGIGLAPILPLLSTPRRPWVLILVRDSLLAELQARLGPGARPVFWASQENREEMPSRIVNTFWPPRRRAPHPQARTG